MDLLRRVAAGELAALFGASALPLDRRTRLHRFRARAKAALLANPAEDVALLRRYVQGVNDGLHALSSRPLNTRFCAAILCHGSWKIRCWLFGRCTLICKGNLQPREIGRGYLREHTTKDQLDFLLPTASKWEAPLDAESILIRFRRFLRLRRPGLGVVVLDQLRCAKRCACLWEATTGRWPDHVHRMDARWCKMTCTWDPTVPTSGIARFGVSRPRWEADQNRWCHASRRSGGGGWQQWPCRVGFYQQLWRLPGSYRSSA